MFCTLIDRSVPNVHPYGHPAIRADGKQGTNGWANSARDVAREIAKTEAYATSRRQRKRSRCCSHT